MEVNAIFVFFDDTKKKDIPWHSRCIVDRSGHQKSAASESSVGVAFFSAALLTKNIPRPSRVSLLSGEIYDRHRESRGPRNNSIIMDARWTPDMSTL